MQGWNCVPWLSLHFKDIAAFLNISRRSIASLVCHLGVLQWCWPELDKQLLFNLEDMPSVIKAEVWEVYFSFLVGELKPQRLRSSGMWNISTALGALSMDTISNKFARLGSNQGKTDSSVWEKKIKWPEEKQQLEFLLFNNFASGELGHWITSPVCFWMKFSAADFLNCLPAIINRSACLWLHSQRFFKKGISSILDG